MKSENKNPVILYDGSCNFCRGAVRTIQKLDKKSQFDFLPLDSSDSNQLVRESVLDSIPDSIVLIDQQRASVKSEAALGIARRILILWPVYGLFKLIPRRLRDWLYDAFARRRYQWFGRCDTGCDLQECSEKMQSEK